jgi:AcrR family transcriptional regulator
VDEYRNRLTVLDQITASDKVRSKIIHAASSLYVKKGFTATSIQEISEKAGVSLPVTYHYVKKKSEIMRIIIEDALTIFRESLLKQVQGIDEPREKLAIAVKLYFRIVDQHRDSALLIYQKSKALDKASRLSAMQLELEVVKIFAKIISEGIARGAFRNVDVDLMAYNIVMMAHMWVLKRWYFKNRLTLDKYTNLQLATIVDALKH